MLWRVIICYLDSLLNTDCLLFESGNLPLLKHTWGKRPAAMLAIYTGKGESQGKYISHMLRPSMNKAAHFKTHRKHKQKSNTEVLISGHQHLKKNTLVTLWLCVLNIIPQTSFHGINLSSQIVHNHPNQYTSTF